MVTAVAMVRDEADIIEFVIRQMASQVDSLVVADNRSVDGTREILESLADAVPLMVVDEPRRAFYQGETITALAERAFERGATWIVPFDADEWFYSPRGRIADVLSERSEDLAIVSRYDHVATAEDPFDEPNPILRMGWRQAEPLPQSKIVCRAVPELTIHQGNHGATFGRLRPKRVDGLLSLRHYQFRSPAQFERKIRNGSSALAETGLLDSVCIHWRKLGAVLKAVGSDRFEQVYYEYFFRQDPRSPVVVGGRERPPLVFDPATRATAETQV